MEIVQLVPDDWAMFRALRLAALSEAPFAFSSTLEGELQLDEAGWRAKLATRAQFVARDPGGSPLGTAGAFREDDVMELISMWVEPRARGRGVGIALVDRIIEHARVSGCRTVYLHVAEDNEIAERLYARAGFTRTGIVEPIRAGEPRLELTMVKVL
jgi:ribosomal protein S18 acetylase RimI-like enzyme